MQGQTKEVTTRNRERRDRKKKLEVDNEEKKRGGGRWERIEGKLYTY